MSSRCILQSWRRLTVDDFMAKLPSLDADFAKRATEAKARGEALRYAATVENGKLTVGLVSVSTSSPLGSLSGTDNLVEYYTTWYDPSPLVVRGAARAGDGATAAGALADMVCVPALGLASPPERVDAATRRTARARGRRSGTPPSSGPPRGRSSRRRTGYRKSMTPAVASPSASTRAVALGRPARHPPRKGALAPSLGIAQGTRRGRPHAPY